MSFWTKMYVCENIPTKYFLQDRQFRRKSSTFNKNLNFGHLIKYQNNPNYFIWNDVNMNIAI